MNIDHNSHTDKNVSDSHSHLGLIPAILQMVRERFRSSSLSFKIAFLVVTLLACTSFTLSITTVNIMNKYVLNEIIKRGESVSRDVAASAAYSLLYNDQAGLDQLVLQIKKTNNDMDYVAILTPDNKIIAHSEKKYGEKAVVADQGKVITTNHNGVAVKELSRTSYTLMEISYPIIFMNKPLGKVVLAVNKSVLMAAQGEVQSKIFLISNIILLLGAITSILMASFFLRPIKELSIGVEKLKKGVAEIPLKIYSDDELGRLTINFNEMSSTITGQQGKLNRYARELEESYIAIVRVVAAAIDARDSYTHGHSARVSQLSLKLGKEIGLNTQERKDLEVACLFHDVGKIKTPDSILLKKSGLIDYEYEEMIHHVEYGASILEKAPSLRKYIPAVRHHHERQDGRGYPDGLSGEGIPLFAAIIAVADTFDAMTSDRPYRKAFSKEDALQELIRVAGTQLRADLVDVFVDIINNESSEDSPSCLSRAI